MDSIHEGFRELYGNKTYDKRTVSTYQADDGRLYYSVNDGRTYPGMEARAKSLGYEPGSRVFRAKYKGPEQTDAEQMMLNAVDKKYVPDTGRIATSRKPCGELRDNGNPAQNCAARIAKYPWIRLVRRYALG